MHLSQSQLANRPSNLIRFSAEEAKKTIYKPKQKALPTSKQNVTENQPIDPIQQEIQAYVTKNMRYNPIGSLESKSMMEVYAYTVEKRLTRYAAKHHINLKQVSRSKIKQYINQSLQESLPAEYQTKLRMALLKNNLAAYTIEAIGLGLGLNLLYRVGDVNLDFPLRVLVSLMCAGTGLITGGIEVLRKRNNQQALKSAEEVAAKPRKLS